MPAKTRWIFLLFSVAVCALMVIEVWGWNGGLIRLPIPIAGENGFPLPLISWAGVALYAGWYGRRFQVRRADQWNRAIRLGFALHALLLFTKLIDSMVPEPAVALATSYRYYWQAVWATYLALGAGGSFEWLAPGPGLSSPNRLFFMPLLCGYGLFWVRSLTVAPGFTIGATILGMAGRLAWRTRAALDAGRWIRIWGTREGVLLTGVFVVALMLRLFYMLRVMTNPDFLDTGSDGRTYDALAWALANRQPVPEGLPWWSGTFFAPGYVCFVGLIYGLVGRSYVAVCAVQAVLGAAACVLMYAVAKRLFGVTVARLAAVFGAVNFSMIFAAAGIGHQAVDLFWTLAVVWCLLWYLERPERRSRWLIGIGLLLGWAAVTREGNIAFWFFLLAWFLLGVRARIGWRRAVLHVAVLSLGFCVVVAPFLRSAGGGIRGRLDLQWFYHQYSSTPINRWFNPWRDPAGAWALVQAQPMTVARRVGEAVVGNFNALFLNQDYGSFDPVFLVRGSPYYFGMWWYAYGLAFVGLVLLFRQAWRRPIQHLGWWLVMGFLVSRASVHLFFESAYRHRAPLEPYLIMLAAFGLTQVLGMAPDPVTMKMP